jgi:SAM-dependent methyltransferase
VDDQPKGERTELKVDPVALTVATYDRVVAEYARLHGEEQILRETREKFARLVTGQAPAEQFRILDAGCGPGRDSAWFADRGFQVVGVDLSAGMLEEARRRAPSAVFLRADLRQLPFPPGSFDGIWCSASLLHLDRDEVPDVLRAFKRLLDHGWLYLAVKEGEGDELTDRVYGPGNLRRFTYFNRYEIELLVERAGFEVREVTITPPTLAEPHAWISLLAQTALRPPLLGATAVIFDSEGLVLLNERADGRGWNLPAGFVAQDEGPRAGIVREVKEETGLDVEVDSLVGVYDWAYARPGVDRTLVSLCFLCRIVGGNLIPTKEALRHGWFSPDQLPIPMSSRRQVQMLGDARAMREGRGDAVYRTLG